MNFIEQQNLQLAVNSIKVQIHNEFFYKIKSLEQEIAELKNKLSQIEDLKKIVDQHDENLKYLVQLAKILGSISEEILKK